MHQFHHPEIKKLNFSTNKAEKKKTHFTCFYKFVKTLYLYKVYFRTTIILKIIKRLKYTFESTHSRNIKSNNSNYKITKIRK